MTTISVGRLRNIGRAKWDVVVTVPQGQEILDFDTPDEAVSRAIRLAKKDGLEVILGAFTVSRMAVPNDLISLCEELLSLLSQHGDDWSDLERKRYFAISELVANLRDGVEV